MYLRHGAHELSSRRMRRAARDMPESCPFKLLPASPLMLPLGGALESLALSSVLTLKRCPGLGLAPPCAGACPASPALVCAGSRAGSLARESPVPPSPSNPGTLGSTGASNTLVGTCTRMRGCRCSAPDPRPADACAALPDTLALSRAAASAGRSGRGGTVRVLLGSGSVSPPASLAGAEVAALLRGVGSAVESVGGCPPAPTPSASYAASSSEAIAPSEPASSGSPSGARSA